MHTHILAHTVTHTLLASESFLGFQSAQPPCSHCGRPFRLAPSVRVLSVSPVESAYSELRFFPIFPDKLCLIIGMFNPVLRRRDVAAVGSVTRCVRCVRIHVRGFFLLSSSFFMLIDFFNILFQVITGFCPLPYASRVALGMTRASTGLLRS